MNFFNPYLSYYFDDPELRGKYPLPYATEVIWIFLKQLNNGLKLNECRINIHFTEKPEHGKTLKLNTIYEFYFQLTPGRFTGDELADRLVFLEMIEESLVALATVNHWNSTAIKTAVKRSRKEIGRFDFVSGLRTSPDKSRTGRLRLKLSGEQLQIRTIIADSGRTVETNLLLTHEKQFSWYRNVKDFGWFDELHFGLKFLRGDLWIAVNVLTGQVQEIRKPRPRKSALMDRLISDLRQLNGT
ncbi:MAG: hypothetical protein V4616_13230 [Bacteroidota bacterium]